MQITPYLNLAGNCREAFAFYEELLGGKLEVMTYGDSPMAAEMPKESHGSVMHARLATDGAQLMGADGPPAAAATRRAMCVALNLDDPQEAERIFEALKSGGEVQMEMDKTFWAERFGMCVDRFGIPWIVNGGLAPEHR